ncbi:MAG: TAXI family TRAP transporter solute-binding subunit [Deltaproteobacteria bacterium]|nr:TAXI family TRAP transporter solute-binding subunit [Deltaproteobacteria bacterium]
MKTLRILLVAIALCLMVSSQVFSAPKEIVPLYTPGSGGTAYFLGGAISKVVNKYVPEVQIMVEATGGAPAMVKLLDEKYAKGQPALGLGISKSFAFAYAGKPPFTKAYTNLRAISFLYGVEQPLLVLKNSPIQTYYDVKGKRIALGAAGSGVYEVSLELMNAFKISKDAYKPLHLGYREVIEGLQDGSIDGGFVAGSYPIPAIQELAVRKEVRVIPVDEKVLKKLTDDEPYYYAGKLKAGAYRGMDKEAPILVSGAVFLTHSKVSSDLMYKITKAIYDHINELIEIHPVAKEMTVENRKLTITFPVHPGVEQYFKERETKK